MFTGLTRRTTARLAAFALAMLVSISTYAGDLKQNPKLAPGLPASSEPTGAAAVGKLMNPRPADSSVPLATPHIADKTDVDQPPQTPQIYGRGEQGGQNGSILEGLVGVRIPFPAARSAYSGNTTSSVSD
jgi:hypothetical protein